MSVVIARIVGSQSVMAMQVCADDETEAVLAGFKKGFERCNVDLSTVEFIVEKVV